VVIDDCHKKISEFGGVTIVHCNREANVPVHELARFSFRKILEGADFLIPFIVKDIIVIE
jgi:hypothetical protein